MERLTRYDEVNKCYKIVREPEDQRSIIQELGVYETIHAKEIAEAKTIVDIRKKYNTNEPLSEYWERKQQ